MPTTVCRESHLGGQAGQAGTPGRRRRFNLVSAFELESRPKSPAWLIEGFIETNTLALLFGDPAAGKSLLALDWAASIAAGRAWCGHEVNPGAVVYLAGEGYQGLTRRLAAWNAVHGQSPSPGMPLFFAECDSGLPGGRDELLATLDQFAGRHGKPALIVVDTLARCFVGNENSADDMSTFLSICDEMRRCFGCAVLIVHHAGHSEKGRARGYSSLPAAMDVIYQLETEGEGRRKLICTKAKDFRPPASVPFIIQEVKLPDTDQKGRAVTAPVLLKEAAAPARLVQTTVSPAWVTPRRTYLE